MRVAALVVVAVLVTPLASGFDFIKVVDTDTQVPGKTEKFLYFGAPSLNRDGAIVFCGAGSGPTGLYTSIGGELRVVADAGTPIPGQTTTFAHGFRSYGASIDGETIAFYAFTQSTELGGGVYLWKDGHVTCIADMSTPVPGGTATFNSIEDAFGFGPFSHPALAGEDVAFRASADNPRQRGVYARVGGKLDVVADLTMPVPSGTGNFSFLGAEISMLGGRVAFRAEGFDLQRGIYTNLTGPLAKVVDKTDPIPGGTGTFTSVNYPWFDAGKIFFTGEGQDGQQGLYAWDGASLSVIVDRSTAIPEGTGTFADYQFNRSQPSSDGGKVLFRAVGAGGQEGIYLKGLGTSIKVIDTSDELDGKSIVSLTTGPQTSRAGRFGFLAGFADGSSGIYIAVAPFLRGDSNLDGSIDLSDALKILFFLFVTENSGHSCQKSLDADDTGNIGITDTIWLLRYLFLSGPPPSQPCPACGVDETPDDLTCERAGACS